MFDSVWLDVAIGLITVFLVFSLVVSGIREFFAVLTAARSKELWNQLSMLLDEKPTKERPDNQGVKTRAVAASGLFSLERWGSLGHRILNALKRFVRRPDRQAKPRLVPAADAQAAGVTEVTSDTRTAALTVDQIVRLLRSGKLEAWQGLYAHPFIRNLDLTNAAAIKTRLSHIPPRDFARTMLDLFLVAGEDVDLVFEELQRALTSRGITSPGASELAAAKAAVLALTRPVATDADTAIDGAFQAISTATAALSPADRAKIADAVAEAREACRRYATAASEFQKIENGIAALLPEKSGLRRVAYQLVGEAGEKLDAIRDSIGGWFDNQMKALSASYRTRTRVWGFAIGLVVAISFNVDTIDVGRELYSNKSVRTAVVSLGNELVDGLDLASTEGACTDAATTTTAATDDTTAPAAGATTTTTTTTTVPDIREAVETQRDCIAQRAAQITDTGLPIGWDNFGEDPPPQRVAGWLVTAAALSFGATFWYDLLKRVTGLRRTDEK